MNTVKRPKKFFKIAAVEGHDAGYRVVLDGKPALTKNRKPLIAPTKALADAITAEWNEQEEYIDLKSMPLTSILGAALSADGKTRAYWIDEIIAYSASDLVCYRAVGPEALVTRQAVAWDPFIDWFKREFQTSLNIASGIIAIEQDTRAAQLIRKRLNRMSNEVLFALHSITALTGSAILALATQDPSFEPVTIFEASRVDEHFQEQKWGVDTEAKERERNLERDFNALVKFLALAV